MATEFQHAPSPGVLEYGFIRTVTEKHKFVEYPAPALLRLLPGHNGVSGNLAVKEPVIAYMFGFRLLPRQMTPLKAHALDVAPLPVEINGAGQWGNIPGFAHEIHSSAF